MVASLKGDSGNAHNGSMRTALKSPSQLQSLTHSWERPSDGLSRTAGSQIVLLYVTEKPDDVLRRRRIALAFDDVEGLLTR